MASCAHSLLVVHGVLREERFELFLGDDVECPRLGVDGAGGKSEEFLDLLYLLFAQSVGRIIELGGVSLL